MKLSILIPMYNAEAYISRCLNSLLNQKLSNKEYEIIVMDDGSTDSCASIVEKFQLEHTHIKLYQEENSGAFTTRNKLLEHAEGEYIFSVDADDYVAYNSLDILLKFAIQNQLDMLGFEVDVTNSSNDYLLKAEKISTPDIVSGRQFMLQNPSHRVEVWWYFIKNEFIKSNSFKYEKNEYNADVVFTFKALLFAKKMAFYNIFVYKYFQSPDSLMRNDNPQKMSNLSNSLLLMVIDFSKLNRDLLKMKNDKDKKVIYHLKKRLGNFIFFYIHSLLKLNLNYKEINSRLDSLKTMNIYPVTDYHIPEQFGLKEKVLYFTYNKVLLFYLVSKTYNFSLK